MVCPNPKCNASVPAGLEKCKRCGFPLVKQHPTLVEEVTSRPWLMALLASSVLLTLWVATLRPSAPPPIPAAQEPVAAAPAPAAEPEPDNTPLPIPAFPSAPEAPAPAAALAGPMNPSSEAPPPPSGTPQLSPDGTWSNGSAIRR